jgi:hypothetical protein
MVEILVSDFCDDRPQRFAVGRNVNGQERARMPATAAGRLRLRHRRGETAIFRLFSIALRIVFSIVSCPGGFSLAFARPCIAIGSHFPL